MGPAATDGRRSAGKVENPTPSTGAAASLLRHARRGGSAAIRVSIDPAYASELRAYLARYGGVADVTLSKEPGILLVTLNRSIPREAARLELDLFLRVWQASRPHAPVQLLP